MTGGGAGSPAANTPDGYRLTTDTSILAEDGSFEVVVPQDEFVGAEATEAGGSIATECDFSGDEVSFPPVQSGGSERRNSVG